MPSSTGAAHAASFLLDMSLRSLVLFGVTGLLCLALRRASAASRHVLWLLTLVSLLCLPVFGVLLPSWSVPILQAARLPMPKVLEGHPAVHREAPRIPGLHYPILRRSSVRHQVPIPLGTITGAMPIGNFPTQTPIVPPRPVSRVWTIANCVCLLWLAGAFAVLAQTLIALIAARRLTRRCHAVTTGPLAEAADMARRTLGLARPLSVLEGAEDGSVAVPMTLGLFRPVVLLPRGTDDWPADRLRSVLLHEAAHVKRLDWVILLLARFACAMYWYHPFVWLAAARLREESEAACDDLVLNSGVPAPDYAAHLLEIVQMLAVRPISRHATVAMAHRREVSQRLRTILAEHQNRAPMSRRSLAIAALVTLGLASIVAVVHPVASASPQAITHVPSPADTGVPPDIAAMMAGHSRWDRTLANGTRIRLLSVAALPHRGNLGSSWAPDGTFQQPGHMAHPPKRDPWAHTFQFMWGIVCPTDDLIHGATISYGKVGGKAEATEHEPSWLKGRAMLIRYGTFILDTKKPAALQLSMATGPKTTLIAASPRTGSVRRLAGGEIISISPAHVHSAAQAHENGRLVDTTSVTVTLPTRFVHDSSEYDFQIIGNDGKPFATRHSSLSMPLVSGGMASLLFTYRTSELPLGQVKEFRFTYRPARTAVFRNIALRPVHPVKQSLIPAFGKPEEGSHWSPDRKYVAVVTTGETEEGWLSVYQVSPGSRRIQKIAGLNRIEDFDSGIWLPNQPHTLVYAASGANGNAPPSLWKGGTHVYPLFPVHSDDLLFKIDGLSSDDRTLMYGSITEMGDWSHASRHTLDLTPWLISPSVSTATLAPDSSQNKAEVLAGIIANQRNADEVNSTLTAHIKAVQTLYTDVSERPLARPVKIVRINDWAIKGRKYYLHRHNPAIHGMGAADEVNIYDGHKTYDVIHQSGMPGEPANYGLVYNGDDLDGITLWTVNPLLVGYEVDQRGGERISDLLAQAAVVTIRQGTDAYYGPVYNVECQFKAHDAVRFTFAKNWNDIAIRTEIDERLPIAPGAYRRIIYQASQVGIAGEMFLTESAVVKAETIIHGQTTREFVQTCDFSDMERNTVADSMFRPHFVPGTIMNDPKARKTYRIDAAGNWKEIASRYRSM